PVGSTSGSGASQPVVSSRRRAASSMLYSQGENNRVWPHWAMAAPTEAPASRTTGVRPRSRTWAAAASPTGPAPIMITGSGSDGGVSVVLGMGGLLKNGGDRGG